MNTSNIIDINGILNQSQVPIACNPLHPTSSISLANMPLVSSPPFALNSTPSISISNASPMVHVPQVYQLPVPVSYQTYIVKPSPAMANIASPPSVRSMMMNHNGLSINLPSWNQVHEQTQHVAHGQTAQMPMTMQPMEMNLAPNSYHSSLLPIQSPSRSMENALAIPSTPISAQSGLRQQTGNTNQSHVPSPISNRVQKPMVLPAPSMSFAFPRPAPPPPPPLPLPLPVANTDHSLTDIVKCIHTNHESITKLAAIRVVQRLRPSYLLYLCPCAVYTTQPNPNQTKHAQTQQNMNGAVIRNVRYPHNTTHSAMNISKSPQSSLSPSASLLPSMQPVRTNSSSQSNSNQPHIAHGVPPNDPSKAEDRQSQNENKSDDENANSTAVGHPLQWYRMSGDGKKFECSTCHKEFQHRSSMVRHIKTAHHMDKPYHCTVSQCGQSFARLHLLTLHSRVHSGEKPYRCPDKDCNKAFKQKAHLTEHIRVHTGEKPYRCEFCDRRFRQKSVLDTHRRRHTGEKPYSCEHCKRDFGHYTSYWRHTNNRICLKKKNRKQKVSKKAIATNGESEQC